MIPMRESLFDALNVSKPAVTIEVDNFEAFLPYTIDVYVNGDKIAELSKGDQITINTGIFELRGVASDDYDAIFSALNDDGVEVFRGRLQGDTYTTQSKISRIVFIDTEYLTVSASASFDIGTSEMPDGIFTKLKQEHPTLPFFDDQMDFDYLTNHSGTKSISNSVMMYLLKYGADVDDQPIKVLTDKGVKALADLIWMRYGDAWTKIYSALVEQYKPLENYSMIEETTPDLVDEFGVSDDYVKTHNRDVNSKIKTESGVYGFNSSDAVPSASAESSGNSADNVEHETETQTGKRIETHTGKSTLTRAGNIGVTTSQQMLQAEIDVRIKNHMDDIIYNDVDQILTTAGYSPILSRTIKII